MEWTCVVIVTIIIPTLSGYSGAGLGSEDDQVWASSVTDTIIHEITITNVHDVDASSYEWTTQPAATDTPCGSDVDCGLTESPMPTQILSIDINDNPTDAENHSDENYSTANAKYGSSTNVSTSYTLDNSHKFFYHALNTIMKQIDTLVQQLLESRIAEELEAKFNSRLMKIENSLGNILTTLRSSNLSRSQEGIVREKSDLVATETWSYIDSKFTELKSNLLNTNEKIKGDLEEKLKDVLNKYSEIDLKSEVHRPNEENISKLESVPEIMKFSQIICFRCYDEAAHSPTGSDHEDLPHKNEKKEAISDVDCGQQAGRKPEVSSKTLLPRMASIASPRSAVSRRNINDMLQNSRATNFHSFKERKVDGKKRSIDDSVVVYRHSPHVPTIPITTNDGLTKASSITGIPMHCADIYLSGVVKSGVYLIRPLGEDQWKVYCDMETDGGGWTVIQRRTFGNVNFTRDWADYKRGFGVITGDFWIGLEKMHILTAGLGHQQYMSLRVDLKDWSNVSQFAHYNRFRISGEHQKYRLDVKDYHGTAGNALQYTPGGFYNHNHQSFSTIDRDHDSYRIGNCGKYYGSGWWFKSCFAANLNGKYYRGTYKGIRDGIYWGTWYRLNDATSNSRHSFKYVDMKIRPVDFERRKSLQFKHWRL